MHPRFSTQLKPWTDEFLTVFVMMLCLLLIGKIGIPNFCSSILPVPSIEHAAGATRR